MRQITFILVLVLFLFNACSYLLLEEEYRKADFIPVKEDSMAGGFLSIDGEDYIWEYEGLRLKVQHLNDSQLNALFPDDSRKGRFSTNPYTYGNWVDLETGITPDRFTVFRIEIHNLTQPVVQLDPLKSRLKDDEGREYFPYALEKSDFTPNDFTSYYLRIRGASGNERSRYDQRIGNVKSSILRGDKVFKGETEEGLIAFNPVPSTVNYLTLELNEFVLSFDQNDWPDKTVNLRLTFQRREQPLTEEMVRETTPEKEQELPASVDSNQVVLVEVKYLSQRPAELANTRKVYEIPGPLEGKVWTSVPGENLPSTPTLKVYQLPGGNRTPDNQVVGNLQHGERITILYSKRLDRFSYYHYVRSEESDVEGWVDWRFIRFNPIDPGLFK